MPGLRRHERARDTRCAAAERRLSRRRRRPQPLTPGQRTTLTASATLQLPAADSIVTGADFHPCGDRMLVRTTESLYELSAPGKPVEALFAATPVKVPVASEPQGEAVTYSLDGRRYFTSSETGPEPPPVNVVSCQAPSL